MDAVTLARVVHVLGVILWVGGVSFLVTMLMPRLRANLNPAQQFKFFLSLARPFAIWMRYVTMAVALSGFLMLELLDGWDRYLDIQNYWWIHLMTLTWVIYSMVLLRQYINTRRQCTPDLDDATAALRLVKVSKLQRTLFTLGIITVLSALIGVHGG